MINSGGDDQCQRQVELEDCRIGDRGLFGMNREFEASALSCSFVVGGERVAIDHFALWWVFSAPLSSVWGCCLPRAGNFHEDRALLIVLGC